MKIQNKKIQSILRYRCFILFFLLSLKRTPLKLNFSKQLLKIL